jgi:uncharacterized cupin superfamily protein
LINNNGENSQMCLSIGSRQERRKRRRDIHYEAIDRVASRTCQYRNQDDGQHG